MVSTAPGGAIDLGGLRLGVSSAATQIEGDCTNTNWYQWYEAGRIADGSSPDVTTRHYRLVDVDTDLLVELGVTDYRMGLEWGRIEPSDGVFDEAALAHYRAEIELLRSRGITPLVTLHHFSQPLWFENSGGWLRTDAPDVFCRFARVVVEALGDLVTDWITVNEPNVMAANGYFFGVFPPGHRKMGEAMRVIASMAAAHICAYRIIHELVPGARVGVANHLRVLDPRRPYSLVDRITARTLRYLFNELATEAMCTGRFGWPLRRPKGVRTGRYYDFLGLNYYTRSVCTPTDLDGVADGVPRSDLGWEIHPEGIATMARWLHERYDAPVWVTENGTCDLDDRFRSRYLWDHLAAVASAGVPIERYYHWCFVDNWEWSEGNHARFGIVANDLDTQRRTIKDSGRFYAQVARAGALTPEAYQTYVAHQEYPRP